MQENKVLSSRQSGCEHRIFAQLLSRSWTAVVMLITLCAIPTHAQYRASLQGSVADSQGAMIPGAQLTLTDTEANRAIIATSNGEGNFVFNQLLPSTYKLEVTRDGFRGGRLGGGRGGAGRAGARGGGRD